MKTVNDWWNLLSWFRNSVLDLEYLEQSILFLFPLALTPLPRPHPPPSPLQPFFLNILLLIHNITMTSNTSLFILHFLSVPSHGKTYRAKTAGGYHFYESPVERKNYVTTPLAAHRQQPLFEIQQQDTETDLDSCDKALLVFYCHVKRSIRG